VAEFNPTGSALVYSTYLGGSGPDYTYGIAVDSAGRWAGQCEIVLGYVGKEVGRSSSLLVRAKQAPQLGLQEA
jgi:hypothetical protein